MPVALTPTHLERYLEVVRHRSIQAAAQRTGRSRATYQRALEELCTLLDAPELMERAPGQRQGILTPAGLALAERAQTMLDRWQQWVSSTKDAVGRAAQGLRVGGLTGTFDLVASLVGELRAQDPNLDLKLVEYDADRLGPALLAREIDLGFTTKDAAPILRRLHFEPLGPLPWVVIGPADRAETWPEAFHLQDLDQQPLVLHKSGPARDRLEHEMAHHPDGPFIVNAVVEVGSTPRVVDLVARGLGLGIVSQVRARFLPAGVAARPLEDGPPVLTAGVLSRQDAPLSPVAETLMTEARRAFKASVR